jgi:hypothetical protein
MKRVLPFTILIAVLLSACVSESSESSVEKETNERMTFCECADFEDEYENDADKEFCEKKMSDWKDKLKNGDEATQQKAMDEMNACIE